VRDTENPGAGDAGEAGNAAGNDIDFLHYSNMTRPLSTHSPFDELAPEYDRWFDEKGRLLFRIELEALQPLLASLPKPWLEIGVGSGRFAEALGIKTGMDPSFKLLQLARERGIRVLQGRGEQMLFKEESWGAVFLIVTLCFLDSPLEVLKEAQRILRPDGKLVLGLVLKESGWGRFYMAKKQQGHRFYRYARFYSYEEIQQLLTEAGYTIERTLSTLFQEPGAVNILEEPSEGYFPDAGFTIITAVKNSAQPPQDNHGKE
jgi:ubiquinone/menaquinone biosynthesis C-methylase UbiE